MSNNDIFDDDIDDEKFDDDSDDDIAGFSSNDDNNTDVIKSTFRTYSCGAKRDSVDRKTVTRKRRKKHDEYYNSPLAQPPLTQPPLTQPPLTNASTRRKSIIDARKRSFSNDFQNSFTEECERKESKDDAKVDITWSDSDSEDRKCFQTEAESPDVASQDKIPLSTQSIEEEETQASESIGDFDSDDEQRTEQLVNKESSPSISPNTLSPSPAPRSPEKERGNGPCKESSPSISPNTLSSSPAPRSPEKERGNGPCKESSPSISPNTLSPSPAPRSPEKERGNGPCKESSPSISPNTLSSSPAPRSPEKERGNGPWKESSPNISPNTPTPTPTPCTPEKEGEIRPPLDSSKKKKQKYLRGGLAERLQQLTVKKSSQMSFWFNKTQQRNREDDDGSPSTTTEDTLTVRAISESLDYGAYVIRCHVVSQDGVGPFQTKQHVIVVLDGEMRKNLDTSLTSKFLRIYSPWRILDPPDFSTPVLVCLTYCEVVSPPSSSFVSEDISESPEVDLAEVISSTVSKQTAVGIHFGCDVEHQDERKEPGNEIEDEQPRASLETVVDWNLQHFCGYQGLCMTSRVNVTARVQRIFWREVETRNQSLNSAGSSLIHSIIENLKLLEKNKSMSLCCLVQGSSGSCCEVRFPQDMLLNRTDWHEMLCQSEGAILSFSKLRLLEQRNRKRSHQLFGLIDSLKNRKNIQNECSKRLKKQQSCSVFLVDEHSSLEAVSEGNVSDYPTYSSPESLNNLNSASIKNCGRVKVYGELLHVSFTKDKFYDTKHVHLWLSGKSVAQDCAGSDVMAEPAFSVIQVRYSSGRTVEWKESTLLPGQLLSMQDLVLNKATPAVLTADIFSKIQVVHPHSSRPQYEEPARDIFEVWRRTMTTTMTDKEYACLKSLPAAGLPVLGEDCMVDSLVMFEGIIFDVDQENAFSWYTCSRCNSEDISEIQDTLSSLHYHCNSCSQEFSSPVTNTRLEVYLKSTPRLNVKVKLLQQTISRLLSGSEQESGKSYDVKCILDKHLGPLYCCVVEKIQDKNSKISFKLEELNSSNWIK